MRFAAVLLAGLACAGGAVTGPVQVHWDRDACEQCSMVIGDRRTAAQVRLPGERRAHLFDDLGCALLWLHEQPGDAARSAEIWVRDPEGRAWLDGRMARFAGGATTPMGYGFATAGPDAPASLALAEVWQRLEASERERRRPVE